MTSSERPTETSLIGRAVQQFTRRFTGDSNIQLPSEDLPVSDTLKLLVPERRQTVLEVLAATDQSPLPVSTIAERVACVEYECRPPELESDQRKRVYIALKQSHLPTLSDANVVSYDPDSNVAAPGSRFSQVWETYTAVLETLS